MPNDVLLLNADVAPVNWVPLSSISWQNAVRLMWLDVVDVLHTYPDRFVHSPSLTIEVPAVVMLRKQVKGFRTWVAHNDSPASHLVFLRDSFTCQYCLKVFPKCDLTIDHVMPRCFGGRTQWTNVTSACHYCNNRRGNNVKIRPKNRPFMPTVWQLLAIMKTLPIVIPHHSWNLYLDWDQNLVQVAGEHKAETDNFETFQLEQVGLDIL